MALNWDWRNESKGIIYAVLLACVLSSVSAQGSDVKVTVNLGEGLIYFLVILFFLLSYCTPIIRWLYVTYLAQLVEKATKEITKASKRFTERMSDANRRITQRLRAEEPS